MLLDFTGENILPKPRTLNSMFHILFASGPSGRLNLLRRRMASLNNCRVLIQNVIGLYTGFAVKKRNLSSLLLSLFGSQVSEIRVQGHIPPFFPKGTNPKLCNPKGYKKHAYPPPFISRIITLSHRHYDPVAVSPSLRTLFQNQGSRQ